ncbi:hypothetical protein VB780_14145 [Leptolyngbya sp. CCNP1308]|uniref:hypothetical protein n=1 Tax=Leptolyngbya sp. CCNP1308 TaxID=3110255 RepID=UPI002B205B78|nr:hypothetical protein [Leptolyngbya sp. CCNP1308]MEA5449719.1 hypothetical protein [Leptolyngbya sp. CCNP1308]
MQSIFTPWVFNAQATGDRIAHGKAKPKGQHPRRNCASGSSSTTRCGSSTGDPTACGCRAAAYRGERNTGNRGGWQGRSRGDWQVSDRGIGRKRPKLDFIQSGGMAK